MGLALAAATGAVLGHIFDSGHFALISALPTLFYGLAWGLLLRDKSTLGKSGIRKGWVASIPLAMANGALSSALLLCTERPAGELLERFLGGAVLGATFGALIWVPALILTLVLFGIPIAWSQRLAEQGLAGEERGERVVGATSAAIGLVAAGLAPSIPIHFNAPPERLAVEQIGVWLVFGLSLLSLLVGGASTLLATHRASRRKQFVSAVEDGSVSGYRIDTDAEGKVLVRIASAGEGYRVADVEEEVAALDEAGEVVAPLERRYL
ncbi:MAG: hypothetical protein HOV80_18875 [Polyangiaceae bacterium]|nr:hypothetical protein [Polyangiaceae bacterium]